MAALGWEADIADPPRNGEVAARRADGGVETFRHDAPPRPLHHRCAAVPLPVPGRPPTSPSGRFRSFAPNRQRMAGTAWGADVQADRRPREGGGRCRFAQRRGKRLTAAPAFAGATASFGRHAALYKIRAEAQRTPSKSVTISACSAPLRESHNSLTAGCPPKTLTPRGARRAPSAPSPTMRASPPSLSSLPRRGGA
jgi:hypothetical protein